MNCIDVQDFMVEYFLEEVSDNTSTAIAMHLRGGCPRCSAFERKLLDGMDELWAAIPEDPISLEDRLLIRERATTTAPDLPILAGGVSNSNCCAKSMAWTRFVPYALAFAASVALMAWIVPISSTNSSHARALTGQLLGELTRSEPSSFAINPATLPTDSEISVGKQNKTFLISMERANENSKIEGFVVWDTMNHEVHFFGSGIGPTPAGMRYVIWLTDEDHVPLASKDLTLDQKGRCKATVVSSMFDARYVFITLESRLARNVEPSANVLLSLDMVRSRSTKL